MRERSAAGGIFRVVGRILLILLVTILLFAVFLLGVMGVLIHGPSAEAERLFVLSVNETSALKFLPHIYLSDAQVDAILHPVSTSTDDEPAPDDNFVELPYEDAPWKTKTPTRDRSSWPTRQRTPARAASGLRS